MRDSQPGVTLQDLVFFSKWEQYAEFWSLPEKERRIRLAEVATSDVTYTDPNTSVAGAEAFSDRVTQFQKDVPGRRFVITDAYEHHQQSLAHWDMVGPDGTVISDGTSYARLAEDGKFLSFCGFLDRA